ncbi:MAG: HIT family protein [Acidobacteriota bacterium]|nr:HIT family protein [Acidobacteriota bacterium]
MSDCLFCKIAARELASEIVFEDADCVAFLDNRPLFPGHVLLIPKRHCETLVDLPEESVAPLFLDARALAGAVEKALDCDGTFVAINNRVSQSVPHLHVHIVPRRKKDGLKGFFWPRKPYDGDDHAKDVARAIREAIGK